MVTFTNAINSTIGASISGATNTLTVTNPSNTASSQAQELITVGGTTSGDCWTQYTVGTTQSYSVGIDNSDTQRFKITQAASGSVNPSTATILQEFDTSNTRAYFPIPLMALGGNTQAVGGTVDFNIQNTSTTAASDSRINIQVSNVTGGNAYLTYTGPANNWYAGVDKSDSNTWKLQQHISNIFPTATNIMTATTAGAISFPSAGFTTDGVLYSNTGGLLASTAAGTAGEVLTSNGAGVAPTFQAVGGASGSVVGQVRTSSATPTSTGTTLANTVTPTTGNSVSLITLAYTAASTGNFLYFDFCCPSSLSSNSNSIGFFLFSGSTLISSFPFCYNAAASTAHFRYFANPLSTSAITYAVYYAPTSGTGQILNNVTSTALYGGNVAIQLTITEVKP